MSEIQKPIFIVGTGRCGSTMFHRILARHSSVGWTSTFNEVFPTQAWLSVFSNLYRTGLPERVKHLYFFPKPFEAYRFWEHYLPGFRRRDRPLTSEDVPSDGIEPVRRQVAKMLRYQRRERFLAKVTGWARIGYFDRIFPDARFLFLKREHRSVVSSWAKAGWLDVTSEIDSSAWQWGSVPDEYRQIWRELDGGAILSVAVKIQLDLDDVRRNVEAIPERCYELAYEDLISESRRVLKGVLEFCELPWDGEWEETLQSLQFYNPVDKWKENLSEEDGERVVEFFRRAEEIGQRKPPPVARIPAPGT